MSTTETEVLFTNGFGLDDNADNYIQTVYTPDGIHITFDKYAGRTAHGNLKIVPVTVDTVYDKNCLDIGRGIMRWIEEHKGAK